jgi:hypothetical protein
MSWALVFVSDDVDVRDAGVFALGLADGPAHDLDGGEALVAGEVEDVVEREFGEDGGDEAEFHGGEGSSSGQEGQGVVKRCAGHWLDDSLTS